MNSAAVIALALCLAYASGITLYGTVAALGLAVRQGWIDPPPGALGMVGSTWFLTLVLIVYVAEFLATLVPGIATAWETVHSLIRPPAAAALAAATAWHLDPALILLAALLGGVMAATTHTTKLGLRYAMDRASGPVTNGLANAAELALVTALVLLAWRYPLPALAAALLLLGVLMSMVRLIWRVLRQVLSGRWMPACGLFQEPRASEPPATAAGEESS